MANNGNSKTLTIVSINGPYRDEAAYTLVRLTHAAKEKGININFFNYLDGTVIGHREQAPKEFPVVEQLFGTVLKKGLKNPKTDAIACIKCTEARGVTKQQTEGVVIGGLYDLVEWTAESDKTILYYWGEEHEQESKHNRYQPPYGKEDAYSAISLAETLLYGRKMFRALRLP